MRVLPLIVLFIVLPMGQVASAQGGLLNIICDQCRDLNEYPEDARNFAVNQVFGAEEWLDSDQSDRFYITDLWGTTVQVDVNISVSDYDLTVVAIPVRPFPVVVPVPIPERLLIQVRVIYSNGDIVPYLFDSADLDPNGTLPVPAIRVEPPAPPPPEEPTDNTHEDEEDWYSEDEEENFNPDYDPRDDEIWYPDEREL